MKIELTDETKFDSMITITYTSEELVKITNDKIAKMEKAGWILIGELESGDKPCLPTGNDDIEPWFLYTKYDTDKDGNPIYWYDITKGILKMGYFDYFSFKKRYSINTILCSYISFDRDHGRLSDGKHLMTKAEGFKIRLAGSDGWIEVDDDYLNGRINMDELELKFRTNKEKSWVEQLKKSKFFQTQEKQEYINNYTIPT